MCAQTSSHFKQAARPPDGSVAVPESLLNFKKRKLLRMNQQKASILESRLCPICLDSSSSVSQSQINCCRHQFCYDCIKPWSDLNPTCPICKSCILYIISSSGVQHPVKPKAIDKSDEEDNDNDNSTEEEMHDETDPDGYEYDGFVVDDDFLEYETGGSEISEEEEIVFRRRKKKRREPSSDFEDNNTDTNNPEQPVIFGGDFSTFSCSDEV
jgi:hypothetical protein